MNLTTDGWIPVVWRDRSAGLVSLHEAFARGEEIADLALRPHERIAVMRLLICVAQCALDGPQDREQWRCCRTEIASAAAQYLKKWRDAFNLFGTGQRFLQITGLKAASVPSSEADGERYGSSTSKLDLALATGNNATLFDNAGGTPRSTEPWQLALSLLTFQCFSPSGRIGVAMWNCATTPGNGSSSHAPCLSGNMLHTMLRCDTLAGSLHRNVLDKKVIEQILGSGSWGRPVWEQMPRSLSDQLAIRNCTLTYLGRLVPLSRAVRLQDDRRSMLLANALEYPGIDEGWREPHATIVSRKMKDKTIRVALSISFEKGTWRELHSLTAKAAGTAAGGAVVLQNVSEDDTAFDLWTGGLVADQGKPVDTTESVFHIPAQMLHEPSQRAYEAGVKYAERSEHRLRRAVSVYHRELGDNLDRRESRDRRIQIQRNACFRFWSQIEEAVPILLSTVMAYSINSASSQVWTTTEWGRRVRRCLFAAYENACLSRTPRQIRAYALGLNVLNSQKTTNQEGEVDA